MAFYEVDTVHLVLVLQAASERECQKSDLWTFPGGMSGVFVGLLLAQRARSSANWKRCHIKFEFAVIGNILMEEDDYHVLFRPNSINHGR